jgi:hypothetical protein
MDPAEFPPSSEPNPTAIAWYVEEAQRVLEDQQRRAESLRTRGGQIAGFGATVLALIGGNVTKLLDALDGCARTVVGLGFIAAALCLAAAVAVAIWGTLKPKTYAAISSDELQLYGTDRFLNESDLWRVHVRSLHGLEEATASAQDAGNSAAKAIEWSLRAFLAGLGFSLVAIVILISELI